MNTINRYKAMLTGLVFILTICGSCKKSFLEIIPKGKQLAQTVGDYDLLFNNTAFITLGASDAQIMSGDEVMTYDPAFTNTSNLKYKNCFLWVNDIYNLPGQDAAEMISFMTPLYAYNKIINEVMTATDGTDQQRKAIKAEALANRAWSYLMLINYYGKPYTATSATTDPGYPILTESDVTGTKFSRGTVQGVYDFIIKDLTAAIPDLPLQVTSRIRMTKWTAEALLGKAYWFMGRYPDALAQFNAAFTGLATGNATIPVNLYDLNQQMVPGGAYPYNPATTPKSILSGPTIVTNQECLFARQISISGIVLYSDYVLASWAKDLYSGSDQRKKFFTPSQYISGTPINADGDIRRNGPTSIILGMTLPDMYLMRAECEARTGDFNDARQDLLSLRRKRMNEADAIILPSGTDPKAWVQFVLDERTREFAMTGYRWFDMRRLSADPMFSGITFTHTYKSSTGQQNFTLKPERLTFRFPQKVIDQNPGMENNN